LEVKKYAYGVLRRIFDAMEDILLCAEFNLQVLFWRACHP